MVCFVLSFWDYLGDRDVLKNGIQLKETSLDNSEIFSVETFTLLKAQERGKLNFINSVFTELKESVNALWLPCYFTKEVWTYSGLYLF
jgi:hypothetical protein